MVIQAVVMTTEKTHYNADKIIIQKVYLAPTPFCWEFISLQREQRRVTAGFCCHEVFIRRVIIFTVMLFVWCMLGGSWSWTAKQQWQGPH